MDNGRTYRYLKLQAEIKRLKDQMEIRKKSLRDAERSLIEYMLEKGINHFNYDSYRVELIDKPVIRRKRRKESVKDAKRAIREIMIDRPSNIEDAYSKIKGAERGERDTVYTIKVTRVRGKGGKK